MCRLCNVGSDIARSVLLVDFCNTCQNVGGDMKHFLKHYPGENPKNISVNESNQYLKLTLQYIKCNCVIVLVYQMFM